MSPLKRILLSSAILLPAMALLTARANGQAVCGNQNRLHVAIHRMGSASTSATNTVAGRANIPYNGGTVLPSSTTYAI